MRKRATLAEEDPHETLYYSTHNQENEDAASSLITAKNNTTTNNYNNTMPASRMQPMSISMGKDYDSTLQQRRESSHRKTIVAILLTSVSLVFSWVVLGARKATVAHQTTSICRSYNAAYFKRLALQISETTDPSHLCLTTIVTNHSQCRCHNPFMARRQDSSQVVSVDQWMDIVQMNAALIQTNYSILDGHNNNNNHRQPDVLLYGDSITERLLGRFFGRYGPKMQEYARVTEQLLTRAGGGSIDGLPLGISSDEVRSWIVCL